MTLLARVASRTPARPERVAEVVAWAGAAVGWLVLVVGAVTVPGLGHGDHGSPSVGGGVDGWVAYPAMVVAMMWPLSAPVLSVVVRSSFRSRRVLHAAIVLAVPTVLWLAFGAVLLVAATVLGAGSGPWWPVAWLGVAMAVSRSPRRARVLRTCLRLPPVHPGGRRGLVTAARAGVAFWVRCALLCGPVMAAMVTWHSPAVMALASASVWWEQWHPRAARDPVPPLLLAAAAAVVVVEWVLR